MSATARVLFRPMVGRGVELMTGIKQDDGGGPLVLCGPSGIATEPPAEPATRHTPLTDREVTSAARRPGLLIAAPGTTRRQCGPRGAQDAAAFVPDG